METLTPISGPMTGLAHVVGLDSGGIGRVMVVANNEDSNQSVLRCLAASDLSTIWSQSINGSQISDITVSPDGRKAVARMGWQSGRLLDLDDGKWIGEPMKGRAFAWSPDSGSVVFESNFWSALHVVDACDGRVIAKLRPDGLVAGDRLIRLCWSRSGLTIGLAMKSGELGFVSMQSRYVPKERLPLMRQAITRRFVDVSGELAEVPVLEHVAAVNVLGGNIVGTND